MPPSLTDVRTASRVSPVAVDDIPCGAGLSAIEWLLHDDQVMRECFRHAAAVLKCVTGTSITAITLLDNELQHYRAEAGISMPPIPRRHSLAEHAVQSDDLFVVEDASANPELRECLLVSGAPFVRFYAAIPIKAPCGERVGVLCAMDPSPRQLPASAADAFRHLRSMIETDLRLRTATAIDPLTRLFNRRFMFESIRRTWDDEAACQCIAIVIIDVDWFKQYNDTYGHPAGDDCLRQVARVLQTLADDHLMIAGRIGGEEFGLLAPEAGRAALERALEHVRAGIERLAIPHEKSRFGVVTVSVGAAMMRRRPDGDTGHQELFAAADEALYRAKAAGRNQVVLADGPCG